MQLIANTSNGCWDSHGFKALSEKNQQCIIYVLFTSNPFKKLKELSVRGKLVSSQLAPSEQVVRYLLTLRTDNSNKLLNSKAVASQSYWLRALKPRLVYILRANSYSIQSRSRQLVKEPVPLQTIKNECAMCVHVHSNSKLLINRHTVFYMLNRTHETQW